MKNKHKIILFSFIGIMLLSLLFSNDNVKAIEYSDDLISESYDVQNDCSGWYDGIDTFFDDTVDTFPIYWKTEVEASTTIKVINGLEHQNVLELYDASSSNKARATYYFRDNGLNNPIWITGNNKLSLSFWIRISSTVKASWVRINDVSNSYYLEFLLNNALIRFHSTNTDYITLQSFNANQWYYIEVLFSHNDFPASVTAIINIDKVSRGSDIIYTNSILLDNLFVETYAEDNLYYIYFDSLCFCYTDTYGYEWWNSQQVDYNLQISGKKPSRYSNYEIIPDNLRYSAIDTLFDKYSSESNNYRTYLINDIVSHTDLYQPNRIARLYGTDNTQNKYKVLQLYFDNLENSNSFRNDLKQFVKMRVDTYDSTNKLLNFFYLNIEFDNLTGLITWDKLYIKNDGVNHWYSELTNPIFNFEDFLEDGEMIESLQFTFQFFLSYNSTNMLMNIKTSVCFNNDFNRIYEYYKLIDAGLRSYVTYNSQSKIKVRYLDYFNYNNATNYLGYPEFTYNNLRGYRTLESGTTKWYYNFLECGFFSTILDYYTPPPLPIPEPDLSELEKPNGFDGYWEYSRVIFYSVESKVTIGNWSFSFNSIHATTETSRIYYNYDTIEYQTIGLIRDDWALLNGIRDFFNWVINALLNIVFWIVNMILLFLQFLYFGLVIVILYNFIFLYLIVSLLVFELLYNFVFYYLLIGLISIGWAIFYALIWLYYEGLREIMIFLARLIAFFISLMIWAFTLCTGNFDEIFDIVNLSMQTLILAFLEIFYEITTNIIVFLSFIAIYTEICFLLLYKYEISKAKGNIVRAERLKKAFDFFIEPLRWIYNLILKIKNLLFGWM